MSKTGVGDFTKSLQPWKDIVDMGLTATPEKRIEEHPRSEVHPWTAHPVYYYFQTVAGISADSPGYKTITVAPNPGTLNFVNGTFPTQQGNIEFQFTFKKEVVKGSLVLPGNITGKFLWRGKTLDLKPGINEI